MGWKRYWKKKSLRHCFTVLLYLVNFSKRSVCVVFNVYIPYVVVLCDYHEWWVVTPLWRYSSVEAEFMKV
jgi:hypothetical protein